MRNRKRRRLVQEISPRTQEAPSAPVVQEETTEETPKRKSFFSKD